MHGWPPCLMLDILTLPPPMLPEATLALNVNLSRNTSVQTSRLCYPTVSASPAGGPGAALALSGACRDRSVRSAIRSYPKDYFQLQAS
jgi:hypothetical protein